MQYNIFSISISQRTWVHLAMNYSFNIEVATLIGVEKAVLIENLAFWIRKNKANEKHHHDGYSWSYNSSRAFAELFPFWTASKIKRMLKTLEDDKYILSGVYNQIQYDRTKWYTISNTYLISLYKLDESIVHNRTMEGSEVDNGKSESGPPIPDVKPDRKPDINLLPLTGGDRKDPLKDNLITKYGSEIVDFVYSFNGYVKEHDGNQAPKTTDRSIREACDVVAKIIRIDKISLSKIKETIRWARKDDFWCQQVKSLGTIRRAKTGEQSKLQKIMTRMGTSPVAQMSYADQCEQDRLRPRKTIEELIG